MTGITVIPAKKFDTKPPALPRKSIDVVAFVAALILAPVVVAAFGFWALLIPVFAVYFGAIPYLVLGTPAYWWMLSRKIRSPSIFALIGAISNIAMVGAWMVLIQLTELRADYGMPTVYFWFGTPFAAVWSAVFSWLYFKLRDYRCPPEASGEPSR